MACSAYIPFNDSAKNTVSYLVLSKDQLPDNATDGDDHKNRQAKVVEDD